MIGYVAAFILTAFLATFAWLFHQIGNDFLLGIFGLLALAPATAIGVVKCEFSEDCWLRKHMKRV